MFVVKTIFHNYKENIMKKFKLFVILSLVIGALFMFGGCKEEKLATPTNVSIDVEDQLTWSEVENARNYLVLIEDEDGEEKELTPKKPKASLFELAEGDYEIRIKAISGDSDFEDSAWTETVYFHKDYETGCIYTLINNNTEYAITKYGKSSGTIHIQAEYRGKPVTEIADKAFKGYSKIENVYVGENVRKVGDGAFQNCKGLKTVTFPETLTEIGESAFQSCAVLEQINIPKGVTEIKPYTFAYCRALKEIKLHNEVKTLGEFAFSDCSSITKLVIPDSVETIGESAFTGNTALKELTIGKKLTELKTNTFYTCTALEMVTFSDESSLVSIADGVFKECRALRSISIPEGVESIGGGAFYTTMVTEDDGAGNVEKVCVSALEEITIPSTVKKVGDDAFFGTKKQVDTLKTSDYLYINNWLVARKDELKESLVTLDASSFQQGLVGIADKVFQATTNLETLVLPETVKYVGRYAFAFSLKLEEATLPGVVEIDYGAFQACEALGTVTIGNTLTTVGGRAFYDCKALNADNLNLKNVTVIGTEALLGTLKTAVGSEAKVLYAGNWVVGFSGKPTVVELKTGTIGIADYAFYKCESLTTITGLSSVEYIGKGAFFGCASLDQISLGNNVKRIEPYTFYGCGSLYTIDLPRNLTSIGKSAFYKCVQLGQINLSTTNVTSIGDYAFYYCSSMQTAKLGTKLTNLGKYAFFKCLSLETVTLPNTSMTTIPERAFYKCESLESITLGDNIESIGEYAFTGCVALKRIKFPAALKTIEKQAFFGCEELSFINFNDALETIGDYAFYGNVKIRTLDLPSGLKNIGKYAFKDCEEILSVILPSNLESIGAHAFYDCKKATFYTESLTSGENWDKYWNSSYKGVVYGCVLSEDKSYVVSVTISATTLQNGQTADFGVPQQDGQLFVGWALSENGEVAYTAEQIVDVPVGTTVYTVWSIE